MKRYLTYALIYGAGGIVLGLCMAYLSQSTDANTTLITLNPNGTRPKADVAATVPQEEKVQDVAS